MGRLPAWSDVVKALGDQQWSSSEKRSGTMWRSPDGSTQVMVHRDPSDGQIRKCLAQMKAGGLQWPPPARGR